MCISRRKPGVIQPWMWITTCPHTTHRPKLPIAWREKLFYLPMLSSCVNKPLATCPLDYAPGILTACAYAIQSIRIGWHVSRHLPKHIYTYSQSTASWQHTHAPIINPHTHILTNSFPFFFWTFSAEDIPKSGGGGMVGGVFAFACKCMPGFECPYSCFIPWISMHVCM